MGILDMNRFDVERYNKQYVEAAKLRGVPCKYYQVKSLETSIIADKTYEYLDPICMNVIFEEVPNYKKLEKLGWYSDADSTLPSVVYLPAVTPEPDLKPLVVCQGCRIDIQVRDSNRWTTFMVEDVKGPIQQCYIMAKLVPYREQKKLKPEDTGWLNKF